MQVSFAALTDISVDQNMDPARSCTERTGASSSPDSLTAISGDELIGLASFSPNAGRFRQIEVLTTVANAFNSLYSQVSGQPVQMIGSSEAEPADVSTEKKSSQARNVAKIIKKTLTKHNLLNLGLGDLALTSSEQGDKGDVSHAEAEEKNELKQSKAFRRKESPWLATVAEETNVGTVRSDGNLANGDLESKETHLTPQGSLSREDTLWREEAKASATAIPDKEPSGQRINPLVAHLLMQPKDSFEMEEVVSPPSPPYYSLVAILALCDIS